MARKEPLYCREVIELAENFDPRSFRVKTVTDKEGNIKAKLIIGCPLGLWDDKRKECCLKRDPETGRCIRGGTRVVSILHFYHKGYCPPGEYAIINRKYTHGKIVPFTKEKFLEYKRKYLEEYRKKIAKILEKEKAEEKEVASLDAALYSLLGK